MKFRMSSDWPTIHGDSMEGKANSDRSYGPVSTEKASQCRTEARFLIPVMNDAEHGTDLKDTLFILPCNIRTNLGRKIHLDRKAHFKTVLLSPEPCSQHRLHVVGVPESSFEPLFVLIYGHVLPVLFSQTGPRGPIFLSPTRVDSLTIPKQ